MLTEQKFFDILEWEKRKTIREKGSSKSQYVELGVARAIWWTRAEVRYLPTAQMEWLWYDGYFDFPGSSPGVAAL